MNNLKKLAGRGDAVAQADLHLAASYDDLGDLLEQIDEASGKVLRRRRRHKLLWASASCVILSAGGFFLAPSKGLDSEGGPPLAEAQISPARPSASDLREAVLGEPDRSALTIRLAAECIAAGREGAEADWAKWAIAVVAKSWTEQAVGFILPLVDDDDPEVAYWAATCIKPLLPGWESDSALRDRINDAISRRPETGGK